jgi:hypothetical protein
MGGAGARGGAAPGGSKTASTEAAKRLAIEWQARQLPRVVRAGYTDTMLPLGALFESDGAKKPAMVWFTSVEPDEKAEKRLFDNWDVAIGARYFNCVKIYVDDIESKALREKYAGAGNTVVFLDDAGREVGRVSGTGGGSSGVYASMQKAAAVDYKKPLTALVQTYSDFLKRFDKVQGKVANLEADVADDLAHISRHDCAPGRKQLKEHEEDLKPLQAERDKLLEQEQSLLKPEVKS